MASSSGTGNSVSKSRDDNGPPHVCRLRFGQPAAHIYGFDNNKCFGSFVCLASHQPRSFCRIGKLLRPRTHSNTPTFLDKHRPQRFGRRPIVHDYFLQLLHARAFVHLHIVSQIHRATRFPYALHLHYSVGCLSNVINANFTLMDVYRQAV